MQSSDFDINIEISEDKKNEIASNTNDELCENDSTPQCRICQCVTSEELYRVCRCNGTMAFVHLSCLQNWVIIRHQNITTMPTCEICKAPYNIRFKRIWDFCDCCCCCSSNNTITANNTNRYCYQRFNRILLFLVIDVFFRILTFGFLLWLTIFFIQLYITRSVNKNEKAFLLFTFITVGTVAMIFLLIVIHGLRMLVPQLIKVCSRIEIRPPLNYSVTDNNNEDNISTNNDL